MSRTPLDPSPSLPESTAMSNIHSVVKNKVLCRSHMTKNRSTLATAGVNFSFTVNASACRKADVSSRRTSGPHNRQVIRSDVPQCADEAIRGSFCVQGADVPNVQEAGHLIRHGGRSREERLQRDRIRFHTSTVCCAFILNLITTFLGSTHF